jgi:tetratricopeptide (TPR) repeat protein
MRSAEWKLIDAPRPELYDLIDDPGERHNVFSEDLPRAEALRGELEAVVADAAGSAATVDDPEVLARLRALGYVGVGAAEAGPPDGLADPKDRIELRNKLGEAEDALRRRDVHRALLLFDEVLAVEPDNRSAVLRSGVALLKMGDLAGATSRLERAVALDPERAEARFALGDALTRSGELERAATQWMELVRLQPRRVEGWGNLGTVLLGSGRPAEAAEAFEQAVQLRPDLAPLRQGLGRAWLAVAGDAAAAGRLDEARRALDRALEVAPDLREEAQTDPRLAPLLR